MGTHGSYFQMRKLRHTGYLLGQRWSWTSTPGWDLRLKHNTFSLVEVFLFSAFLFYDSSLVNTPFQFTRSLWALTAPVSPCPILILWRRWGRVFRCSRLNLSHRKLLGKVGLPVYPPIWPQLQLWQKETPVNTVWGKGGQLAGGRRGCSYCMTSMVLSASHSRCSMTE